MYDNGVMMLILLSCGIYLMFCFVHLGNYKNSMYIIVIIVCCMQTMYSSVKKLKDKSEAW